MSGKVRVSAEVAKALDEHITTYGREELLSGGVYANRGVCEWKDEYKALEALDLMTLATAVVNGYEVEKTPEENLQEFVERMQGRHLATETVECRNYYAGVCRGVVKTLDILGIKIEGVNVW